MNEEIKPENMRIHSRADELIACLEGEIAKRDARIVELESRYQRDVYGLNNEGDPIGGDPAGGYANDNARLRAELAAIKAQGPLTVEFMQFMTAVVTGAGLLSRGKQSKGLASELSATAYKYMLGAQVSGYQQKPIGYRCWFNKEPKNIMFEWGKSLPSDMNPSATYQELYAAPVSEAKAQGVVQWPDADEIMQMAFEEGQPADDASGYCFELEEFDLFIERLMSEVARLNASLVQQASVPDERANFESEYLKANYPRVHSGELSAPPIFGQTGKGEYEDDDMQKCWVMWQARAMLDAALYAGKDSAK